MLLKKRSMGFNQPNRNICEGDVNIAGAFNAPPFSEAATSELKKENKQKLLFPEIY